MNEPIDAESTIDIIINVPKCKPRHNHTIELLKLDFVPDDFQPIKTSKDNKKLIINKDLYVRINLLVVRQIKGKPLKNSTFTLSNFHITVQSFQ